MVEESQEGATGQEARNGGAAVLGGMLALVACGVALDSVFGSLMARWYVVAVLVAGASVLLALWGSAIGRRAGVVSSGAVLVAAALVILVPWQMEHKGAQSDATGLSGWPHRPLFVQSSDGYRLDGVVLPHSGRYVNLASGSLLGSDQFAVSSTGWVFTANETSSTQSTLVAHDLTGRILWHRRLGQVDVASGQRQNGVLSATHDTAVVIRCPASHTMHPKHRCTAEAIDRAGHTQWKRKVTGEPESASLWSSDTTKDVPTHPWLWASTGANDSSRVSMLRLDDGSVARHYKNVGVVRLGSGRLLLISDSSRDSACRVRGVHDGSVTWTRRYHGAICLASSMTASGRVAYPASGIVLDLRTGHLRRYPVVGRFEGGSDLILRTPERTWVTDPLSGDTLWQVSHDATPVTGPDTTALYWRDKSINPFRPRDPETDMSSQGVQRVEVAAAGSRHTTTCDLPSDTSVVSVIDPHRLLVMVGEDQQIWSCP